MPIFDRHAKMVAGVIKPKALFLTGTGSDTLRKLGPSLIIRGTWGEMKPKFPEMRHADDAVRLGKNLRNIREKECHEDSQNPDHHKDFWKGETCYAPFLTHHGGEIVPDDAGSMASPPQSPPCWLGTLVMV
jgi:hypothetical protein